jgi:hypothetical protein
MGAVIEQGQLVCQTFQPAAQRAGFDHRVGLQQPTERAPQIAKRKDYIFDQKGFKRRKRLVLNHRITPNNPGVTIGSDRLRNS